MPAPVRTPPSERAELLTVVKFLLALRSYAVMQAPVTQDWFYSRATDEIIQRLIVNCNILILYGI